MLPAEQETLQAGFAGLSERLAKLLENQRLEAPNFNLFRLLGVKYDEVKTHSAFIADLLNPDGSHGQGDAFLKSFLTCVAERGDLAAAPAANDWVVTTEECVLQGKLDIVVRSWSRRLLLVIENKVRAGEREDQLANYWEWMTFQKKCFDEANKILIFLTPDGHPPLSAGAAKEKCLSKSYERDVVLWLDSVLPEIRAKPVQYAVEQYRRVCAKLRRDCMDRTTDACESEIEFLKQPENFKMAQKINDLLPKVISKFWEALKARIEKESAFSGAEVRFVDDRKPEYGVDIFSSPVGNERTLRIRIQEDNNWLFGGICRPVVKGKKQLCPKATFRDIPDLDLRREIWEVDEHPWWVARTKVGTGSVKQSKIPLLDLEEEVLATVKFLFEKSKDFLDRCEARTGD